MARWVRVLAVGGEAVMTTRLANAGSFLLPVTCVLALVVVVTASCAMHSHFRRSRDNNSSTRSDTPTPTESSTRSASPTQNFKPTPMSPDRALNNSSKKPLISEKREEIGQENEAYDCGAKVEEGGAESVWQRRILMGERCQPPNFSGQIVYDHKGNRLSQFPPRTPNHYLFQPSSQTDALQRPYLGAN